MWSLGTKWDTRELAEHLRELLEQVDGSDDALEQLMETATVDFFCGFSEGQGFELPPDVLKRLGEIGVPLGICMYGDPEPMDNFDDNLMNIEQNR